MREQQPTRLLFIDPQEKQRVANMKLPPDQADIPAWIATATGLPPSQITTVNVADGDRLPTTFSDFDAVLGGGSGHSVNAPQPWMEETAAFLQKAMDLDIPVFGICFSHQILAKTRGAHLEAQPEKRLGPRIVELTDAGEADPVLRGPKRRTVYGSNRDAVVSLPLPTDGLEVVELARQVAPYEDAYEILAFRDSKTKNIKAYSAQFHPELTFEIVAALAGEGGNPFTKSANLSPEEQQTILEAARRQDREIRQNGQDLMRRWLKHVVEPSRNR